MFGRLSAVEYRLWRRLGSAQKMRQIYSRKSSNFQNVWSFLSPSCEGLNDIGFPYVDYGWLLMIADVELHHV